jgi:aminoglycoside phosphotransferase
MQYWLSWQSAYEKIGRIVGMEMDDRAIEWARKRLPEIISITKARHGDQSRVYHLQTPSGNFILKVATALSGERDRLAWVEDKALVPRVIEYTALDDNTDALLMTELVGKNLASHKGDWSPEVVVKRLASAIRDFHAIDITDCPFGSLEEGKVLVHGDACLPNFIFDGERFSGYVDLGDMRIDYPEVDLSAAIWSLQYNLGTGYGSQFLTAYGYPDSSEDMVEKLRLQYEEAQRVWGLSR